MSAVWNSGIIPTSGMIFNISIVLWNGIKHTCIISNPYDVETMEPFHNALESMAEFGTSMAPARWPPGLISTAKDIE